jgi:hypothetical protein
MIRKFGGEGDVTAVDCPKISLMKSNREIKTQRAITGGA